MILLKNPKKNNSCHLTLTRNKILSIGYNKKTSFKVQIQKNLYKLKELLCNFQKNQRKLILKALDTIMKLY